MITPFLIFVIFEITWMWPSVIYVQVKDFLGPYPVMIIVISFVIFILCYLFALKAGDIKKSNLIDFRNLPIKKYYSDSSYFIVICIISSLLLVLSLYYYGGMPPLVNLLVGLAENQDYFELLSDLSGSREIITKGHYYGEQYRAQGLMLQTLQIGWPFIMTVAFLIYYKNNKIVWLIVSVLLLISSIIFIAGSGERYQAVMVIIYCFIVVSFIFKIILRHIFTYMLIPLCIIILLVVPLSGQLMGMADTDDPALFIATAGLERISLGNGLTSMETIDFIDKGLLDFGMGKYHLEKFLNSIPGLDKTMPLSRQIQLLRNPDHATTFASMTNFGILYADGGPIFVCVGYALIGLFAGFVQNRMTKMKKEILEVPLVAFFVFYFVDLSLGSFVSVAASLVVLLIFYGIVKILIALVDNVINTILSKASPKTHFRTSQL